MKQYAGFEQGPIRPPSEASSLLLRVNRNCPWNSCTFCSLYKKRRFSLRPVEDVLRDIDAIHLMVSRLDAGEPPDLLQDPSRYDRLAVMAALNWRLDGMESVFLQDADCLTIRPEHLVTILRHLKTRFPQVRRVTAYARSESIARVGAKALREIARAGLSRIHVGMETASDTLLKLVQKGVAKRTQIAAGRMVKDAGIELSEYFLVGLGGTELSAEHAVESADALNQIDPDFIRFRTLQLPESVELFAGSDGHDYRWAPDAVQAREIETFIWHLDGITSAVKSDHGFNLFQEIDGVLPHDKARLLQVPRRFLQLDPELQTLFKVGKRSGHFRLLDDMALAGRLDRVREICRGAGINAGNADEAIREMLQERMRSYW